MKVNFRAFYKTALFSSVLAANTAMAQLEIEEIIVTAQKRAESVQDIPSTVNAVTGDALDHYEIKSFEDLSALSSGLSLDRTQPNNPTIAMRGVSFDPDSNARASVETYWNEMPVSVRAAFQQVYDVERIEVLRGPQGTLQGRTSPGGAIHLHTRKADLEDTGGYIKQSLAGNDARNTQVALNLPLTDTLAARFAGVYDSNAIDGIELEDGTEQSARSKGGRITLNWQPSDTFSSTLVSEYLASSADAFEDVTDVDDGAPGIFDSTTLHDGKNLNVQRNELHTLKMVWDLSDDMELTSVTGYREIKEHRERDLDRTGANTMPLGPLQVPVSGLEFRQTVTTQRKSMVQEVRLDAMFSDFWEYTAGAYYEDQRIVSSVAIDGFSPTLGEDSCNYFNESFGAGSCAAFLPLLGVEPTDASLSLASLLPPELTQVVSDQEQMGVFTHNRFHLSESTTLQAGLRWSKYNLTPPATDPTSKDSFSKMTGGLKLSHNLDDVTMLYVSLDRSYRPGNGIVSLDQTQLTGFGEENSDSIELGIKTTLWSGRAQINAAIYQQEFEDYITRAVGLGYDSSGDGTADSTVSGGIPFNGDALMLGAEVDAQLLLSEQWLASVGLSYNDATFSGGAQAPCSAVGDTIASAGDQLNFCDVDGQRVGGEPNWSVTLGSEYIMPVSVGEAYVRGLYKFNDHRSGGTGTPDVSSYGVLNLYTGVRSDDGWEASLWMKNALDEEAEKQVQEIFGFNEVGNQINAVAVIPERQIGITATYNFSM